MAVPSREALGGGLRTVAGRRRARVGRGLALGELVFIAPAALLIAMVVLLPTAIGLAHAFTDWQPGSVSPFVGLDNFAGLVRSPVFRQIVGNELFYLLGLPLWVGAPLLLALLLHERVPVAGLFRTIFFFPSVLSPVIVGIVFTFMLGTGGVVNRVLAALGLGALRHQWLSDPALVKPVIICVLAWAGLGTGVVMFSASLSSLPPELLEAARIDGARWGAQLRYVMLPHLLPVVAVYAVLQVINVFLWSFAWIYVLTQGGPGYASSTLDYDIYQRALSFGQFGPAAAESALLLLAVAAITVGSALVLRLVRRSA